MPDERRAPQILVVDDDAKLLDMSQELLRRHGFGITTCADSAQVMPLLKVHPYDAVLLDIQMPGTEGTDLLPLIKKGYPELPVILVSAYCDETNLAYYYGLGASGVVNKPFSHEVLLETLTRALDHQQRIPLVLTGFSLREARDQVYRKLMLSALRSTNWNQVKAAHLLGVSRYCLIRWIKKLGISY